MSMMGFQQQARVERTVEHIRRIARSWRTRDENSQRRQAMNLMSRRPDLDHLIDERLGYAKLPVGMIPSMPRAVEYAQRLLAEGRNKVGLDKSKQLIVLTDPSRYEEAPPLFDLALSDEVLQIAADYLGEVPVMMRLKVWWTPVNEALKGSQLYHRDGLSWLKRQAKFLVVMNDVDENSGPFTFLPADISSRIARTLGSVKDQERVSDEVVHRYSTPADAIPLVGPAGTGAVVDSARCFHFGARARRGERLMLVFNFMPKIDVPGSRSLRRTAAFDERFGHDDEVRKLVVPRAE